MNSVARMPVAERMNNRDMWHAWVDYNGSTQGLEVRLGLSNSRPALPLLEHNVDLAAQIASSGFVGFTSGTGAAWGNHDILAWEFRDTYNPLTVPEPATGTVLAALTLLPVGYIHRRRIRG